jgi:aspartyl-tRNA(Asn)/glutamyl-tRNA(Gln) amidotransferase subunit A
MAAGKVSSEELLRDAFAAIARLNPALNAFLTLMEHSALTQARQMDRERAGGNLRSPLHGIPVAVKDVFCTRGVRTTCGTKVLENYVPNHDAAVVEKLHAAGAVIVGKTGMHEFAYGVTSNNPHYGPVRNPWNTDCIPGGSSGGSGSAVAAGMVFMAMGSDTGGSIRIPAGFCGTVGIKPTTGRVSRYGVLPLDFTLDHMGPLTRTVADAAICLEALAGADPRDPSSSAQAPGPFVPPANASFTGVRIGIPSNFFYDRLEPAVEAATRAIAAAAEKLGARLVPVRLPDIAAINTVGRVILFAEAAAATAPFHHRRSEIGADVMSLIDQGRLMSGADYVNAQRLRRQYMREFAQVWREADILLTPTTPNTAPRIGEPTVTLGGILEDVRLASTRLVRGFNVLGLPALALPSGVAENGLPTSVQLIGKPFDEAALFRAGSALEQAGAVQFAAPPSAA